MYIYIADIIVHTTKIHIYIYILYAFVSLCGCYASDDVKWYSMLAPIAPNVGPRCRRTSVIWQRIPVKWNAGCIWLFDYIQILYVSVCVWSVRVYCVLLLQSGDYFDYESTWCVFRYKAANDYIICNTIYYILYVFVVGLCETEQIWFSISTQWNDNRHLASKSMHINQHMKNAHITNVHHHAHLHLNLSPPRLHPLAHF